MKPRVLIAEQSPNVARFVAAVFEAAGYVVIDLCQDGLTALERVQAFKPDVLAFDILLPRLDGLKLAAAAHRAGIQCALVAVTAVNARHRVEEAQKLGVSHYMLKPVDQERLLKIAQSLAPMEATDAAHI